MLHNKKLSIKSLGQTSLSSLTHVFNTAFEGYFVPVHLTVDTLHNKIKLEDISLDLSVGAFDGTNLVGFMLHGIRRHGQVYTAYNAGTGVLPAYRKQALVGKMYQFQFQRLRQAGVNEVFLEVIVENKAAIKAYTKAHFSISRKLNCYKGLPPNLSITKNEHVTIKTLERLDLKELVLFWNYLPSWQHQLASVQNAQALTQNIALIIDKRVVAYSIIMPNTGRILQFAVHQEHRRQGLGKLLLQSLSHLANPHLSILNVDNDDIVTNQFFHQLGFELFIEQYEMTILI